MSDNSTIIKTIYELRADIAIMTSELRQLSESTSQHSKKKFSKSKPAWMEYQLKSSRSLNGRENMIAEQL